MSFCGLPQVKSRLFPIKSLPLWKSLGFAQFDQKGQGRQSWFDVLATEGCR